LKCRSHFERSSAVLILLIVSAMPMRGGGDAGDQLKCATLVAFLQNARWTDPLPEKAPLTVGVIGRSTFIRLLSSSVEGRSAAGHPIRILSLSPPVDLHCCQVLYFATDKAGEIKPAMQTFTAGHALTIGEADGFLEQGGAVNLFFVDGHMTFEVSLGALGRAGVEISSKLLRFGQIRDLAKERPAR
jgi:prepilin-type processing-associated H-X9-DG protein